MAITAQTRTELVQLVVSMLGQAPSTAVLTDLVTKANAGSTLQQLADELSTNAKFASNYPVWLTASEFTAKVVKQMFAGSSVSQADTDAAVDYIAGAITAGTFTKTSAVVALTSYLASADGVANATYGSAAQVYQNKVAVAEYYTITAGLGDKSDAELAAAIAGVTDEADAVATAKAAVEAEAAIAALPTPEIKTLTTAADTLATMTGKDGADQFFASIGANGTALNGTTLNAGDMLDGADGSDTLFVSAAGTNTGSDQTTSALTLKNIETVDISNFEVSTFNTIINMAQSTGIEDIKVSGSAATGDTLVTNLRGLVGAEMWSGTGDLTIGYAAAATAGTADTQTLALNAQTGGAFTVTGVEALSITSAGTAKNAVAINDAAAAAIKTMTITGGAQLTLTEGAANPNDAVTVINAADMTGSLRVTTGSAAASQNITGGSGADIITSATFDATDTITGGDGIDTLIDTAGTALTQAIFAKTTGVEAFRLTTDNSTITLASDVAPTTFDLTNGAVADTKQTLTLSAGALYTNATTVNIDTDVDVVTNSANVVLTVNGTDAAVEAGDLSGGTKADTINMTTSNDATAGGFAAVTLSTGALVDGFETINIVDGGDNPAGSATKVAGKDVSITTGAYATNLTVDASALDAGTFVGVTAQADFENLTLDASGMTAKTLNAIGGAGRDTITGGSRNDTIDGGAGADTIVGTAGGNDNVKGGAGGDTFSFGGALTAADTVDGGDGTDTLLVTALSAAALANVSNVETLAFSGTATLATDLAFSTIVISTATVDSLTLAPGYTAATTVSMGAADTVTDSVTKGIALTTAFSSDSAVTIAAGTTATDLSDTAIITASSSTVTTSGAITGVDKIIVKDTGDAATGSKAAGQDITIDLTSYGTKLDIDASALDVGTLAANGTANADFENLTITGVSAQGLTVTGGGGDDTIVGSSSATVGDVLNGGGRKDTFTMNNNLTYEDTIDGGDSSDTLSTGTTAITDIAFMNVSNVETYLAGHNAGTGVLSGYFDASGISTVVYASTAAGQINSAGVQRGLVYSGLAAVNDNITAGGKDDTFVVGTNTITYTDSINGGAGTDTLSVSNTAARTLEVDLTDINKVERIVFTNADGRDLGTPAADVHTVTIGDNGNANLADNGVNGTDEVWTIDASVITDTLDPMNFSANGILDPDYLFNVTGGAAAETLVTGSGADTIVGGGGADTIDGGVGADQLTGGTGKDIFNYASLADSTNAKTDTITDFATGSDRIVVDITVAGGGTLDGTNKGTAADNSAAISLLSSKIGQYYFNTTTSEVVFDTDGNGLAQASDGAIGLTGLTAVGAADISWNVTLGNGEEVVTTGGGNDVIDATDTTADKQENINTGAGNDTINFAAARLNDTTDDTINGGTGVDTLRLTGTAIGAAGADGTMVGIENITLLTDASTYDFSAQTEKLNITTANGANSITVSAATGNSVTGGTAVDTIVLTQAQLTGIGTIAGGTGTDILQLSAASTTLVDSDFGRVSAMETVQLTGASTGVFGANAQAAGITVVKGQDSAAANNVSVTSTSTALAEVDAGTTNNTGTTIVQFGDLSGNAGVLKAGNGNVTLTGGAATDTTTVTGIDTATQKFTAAGYGGSVVLTATAAASITGSPQADTITAGAGVDTIIASAGDDVIDLGAAGNNDIYIFAATAALNGSDTLTNVVANADILNFKNIFGSGIGSDGTSIFNLGLSQDSFSASSNAAVALANKVHFFHDTAANGGYTATNVLAEIGTGKAFSLASGGKGVIFTGDNTGANDKFQVWLVDDTLDGNSGTVSAADIQQIGISAAAFDLNTLVTGNTAYA